MTEATEPQSEPQLPPPRPLLEVAAELEALLHEFDEALQLANESYPQPPAHNGHDPDDWRRAEVFAEALRYELEAEAAFRDEGHPQ